MTLRVRSQVIGSLPSIFEQRLREDARAITDAMRTAGRELQGGWRAQILGAGVSPKVANAVRLKSYPQVGESLHPAALVYVKPGSPEKLIANMRDGAVIRSVHGKFLAIPTESVPKGDRGKKLTPQSFQAQTGIVLRFAVARDGTKLLVGDRLAQRGGKRVRSHNRSSKSSSQVYFILTPQATVRKRLDLEGETARAESNLAGLIAERLS